MIRNLADIRYARFNSSFARRLLGLMFRAGAVHRIWFGPLRGLRMRYDPSVNFHAVLGLWDSETFDLLDRVFVKSGLLPEDSTVADVGGNIGYYTMWLCTVAVAKGRVYSFEPSPDSLKRLRDNLDLNDIKNCDIIDAACGDDVSAVEFFIAEHHHSSSLHKDWAGEGRGTAKSINVRMTSLDAFFAMETGRSVPAFIKMDIEGGATFALPGCRRVILAARPFFLVESHMPEEDRAISNVLCEFDYRGYRLSDGRWVVRRDTIHPDADGVWGTLLLVPAEQEARVAKLIEGS